ncbi:DHA2 family efflux MFS transporter permease subunit [Streptomyces solicathayae]|uniref:DHA2 family efflux MFS transporter permease subunit n=1 Tax=Streptomyces solicathayae TaxID=3081768 RepID=A0ABZ0LVH6_9ACTN|nr:DHA2 family efflux MFS transporter permease subunit [Streptomyces sp. HUAS YS2]WOX23417.1 DHA2 family efflux MFS transporter permease subunit [Streptomyces sp. HUAS YS2]
MKSDPHAQGHPHAHTPSDAHAHTDAHTDAHAHTGAHAPSPPPDPRRWTALALICTAQFMLILDVTVVNVALPTMAADLGLGRSALTWAVTAYTLCFGGLMLLGGRLADGLGARRTLLAGLALFTAASLACGLAPDAATLLTGRIAQGVGAALLSPAALSLVTTGFHGAERTKALGVWAAIGGTGSAVGVLLGGALADGPGWRWVFYVNVPVGLALLAALPAVVRARAPQPPRGLDVPGALLVTTATGALVYGLVRAGDAGWTSPSTLLPLLGALLLYGVFAAVERASRAPLMDPRMFTRRPVVAGSLLMLVATALLISFFFLGSVQLQHLYGYDALRTGLVFLPVAVTTAVGAHLAARLVGSLGSRPCAAAGLTIAALGCAPLPFFTAESDPWTTLLPALSVAALGLGAVFVTATTTALGMTAPHEAGLASGIINTFHEVGGSIGVAVVSTIAGSSITTGTLAGYRAAFITCALTAAATALLVPLLVPPGRPRTTGGPHAH